MGITEEKDSEGAGTHLHPGVLLLQPPSPSMRVIRMVAMEIKCRTSLVCRWPLGYAVAYYEVGLRKDQQRWSVPL